LPSYPSRLIRSARPADSAYTCSRLTGLCSTISIGLFVLRSTLCYPNSSYGSSIACPLLTTSSFADHWLPIADKLISIQKKRMAIRHKNPGTLGIQFSICIAVFQIHIEGLITRIRQHFLHLEFPLVCD